LVLLWLLVVAQTGSARPQYEVTNYLKVAEAYATADHDAALREIRQWRPSEIKAAVADLRGREDRLRAVATGPKDIAFGTVEAAVLMHAEAGLLALQGLGTEESELHLRAAMSLFNWSRQAAGRARSVAAQRALLDRRHGGATTVAEIRERIDRVQFYQALAAATLAMGFPETARPFALEARQAAPLDAEVQLVFGCAAESLAGASLVQGRADEAARLQEEASGAMRDALAVDPRRHEARLRLGRLLLARDAVVEAEPALEGVARDATGARERYLARLFLARLAERRGRSEDAARHYAGALELWPDSQAARLGLALVLERNEGPAAARPVVGESLSASRRPNRATDPWWVYPFGPPGIAEAALGRVWQRALGR
jgi:tetratricopeptide (TPR) repeat protein